MRPSIPPLFPPRFGAGAAGRWGRVVRSARSGRRRPFVGVGVLVAVGGPWSEGGVSGATGRSAGRRRPAPPRVPGRVRGRGVSPSVSVSVPSTAASGAEMGSAGESAGASAFASGSADASVAVASVASAAAARERPRPAPPRVPRRARGRGASVAGSSLATGSSGAGVSTGAVSAGVSDSVEAAVVFRVRPPRRRGFSSAAVSSAGALADASLPPCRDRFRKESHSEITRSPQDNFVRCTGQRFSLRWT